MKGGKGAAAGKIAPGLAPTKRALSPYASPVQPLQKFARVPVPSRFSVPSRHVPVAVAAEEPSTCTAEVRFDGEEAVQIAMQYHETEFMGAVIGISVDEKSKDGTKIIVSGVLPSHSWKDLKDHFSACGTVLFCDIKKDGNMPCCGQVRFDTPEEAQQALQLNGTLLGGHTIEIKAHSSKDPASMTKLQVLNLPPGLEWQDLKDHFINAGVSPAFVDTSTGKGGATTAEVRFDDPEHVQAAMESLQGSVLGGSVLQLTLDSSQEREKIIVTGLPAGIEWQELKDHFNQVGQVGYCHVNGPKGKGKGVKGGAKGAGAKGAGAGVKGGATFGKGGQVAGLPAGLTVLPNGQIVSASDAGGKGKGMFGKSPMSSKGGCAGGFAKGGGKQKGGFVGGGRTGEVRYDFPQHAEYALLMLNGTDLMGQTIGVTWDLKNPEGTKLVVTGLDASVTWQSLKDHMAQAGQVAFVNVK